MKQGKWSGGRRNGGSRERERDSREGGASMGSDTNRGTGSGGGRMRGSSTSRGCGKSSTIT